MALLLVTVGGAWLARRFLIPGPTAQRLHSRPGQAKPSQSGLPRFGPQDPAFRPVEATSQELIRQAIDNVGRLVDCFPDDPATIDVMARLQYHFGNSEEATAAWQRCLELDSDCLGAYLGLGAAAASRDEHAKAAECFRKAMALDPASPKTPIDLAYALTNQGKLDEVVALLEERTRGGLRSMPTFLLLGQAYQQLREYDRARENFEIAVEMAPDYASARYGLAMACAGLGLRDEAKKHREEFRKLEAKDRQRRTRHETAVDDELSVRERLALAYTDAARVYVRHQDEAEAEAAWRRAAGLDPKNVACREGLVALYERNHREEEALLVCRELLDIEPANADYALNVGLLSARLNQSAAAKSAVQRAIELDPENPRYREVYRMIEKGQ